MTIFTLLNLLSVRSWGESEYWFASIKVAAIMLFLVVGVVVDRQDSGRGRARWLRQPDRARRLHAAAASYRC